MGVGASVFSGTTVGAGNESDPMPTCWPEQTYPNDWGRGADRAFLWQPPSPGTYVIDTAGSSFDTVLYVRSACDAAADIACNDDVQAGVMRSSAVTLTSSSSTPAAVIIVVDGFTTDQQGSFVVNITRM